MNIELSDKTLLKCQAYINGEWVDGDSGETYDVTNPADESVVAKVAKCGAAETRRAIHAADEAMRSWRAVSASGRASILRKWYDLLMENQEDLARIMTAEQGKPLAESRGEIAYSAGYVEWAAEEGKRLYGDTIPSPSNDKRLLVVKQPVGVVACITPWNFPTAMLARKVAPALAVGCAVIAKPANYTPLSALAFAELGGRAGVPRGLVNIVSGRTAEIGEELTSNPMVRKLTFTGSTEVGKMLVAASAKTMKRTSMELGGNAPFIVFDDADLDEAVKGAIICKFRNAGQTCVCANRFLVQETVYDEFTEKLMAATAELPIGNGAVEGVKIGPLISEEAANDVCAFIDDAVNRGATVAYGGGRSDLGSHFVNPTVLTDVNDEMRVFNEEIFGPVAPLFKFRSEDEAIRLANDTPFGLASYFYARDVGRIWRVAEGLEYGIVGINEGIISNPMAPFGGIKESGHGREGSMYGLDDYTDIKYLCLGGLDR